MASPIPTSLRNVPQYTTYLAGAVTPLPPYQMNERGEVVTYHGEVFCRHPDCSRGLDPFSTTRNLRAHLRCHGYQVETTPTGRLSQTQIDRTIAWYRGLGGGTAAADTSEEEEEDEEQDNEDDEDKDEENEEDEENEDEEDDEDDEDSDDNDDEDYEDNDEGPEEIITGMVIFFTIRR